MLPTFSFLLTGMYDNVRVHVTLADISVSAEAKCCILE